MKLKRVYGVRQKARDVLSVVEAMDKVRCWPRVAHCTSHVTLHSRLKGVCQKLECSSLTMKSDR